MKAAMNGTLNCSVLDGWWAEMYDPEVGWAVPSFEWIEDLDARDVREGEAVYSLLEREIVPMFYERGDDGLPHEWIRRNKESMARLLPAVSASRMVREYVERYYEPAARRSHDLRADASARARALAGWKKHLQQSWTAVSVGEVVETAASEESDAAKRAFETVVRLGAIDPDDVEIDLVWGPVDDDEVIDASEATPMTRVATDEHGAHRFRAEVAPSRPGTYGVAVRVTPSHADLADPAELGLVAWSRRPPGIPEVQL
jgi:glycogen phosphorylase